MASAVPALPAARYFLIVFLLIPRFLAIPRAGKLESLPRHHTIRYETPLSLGFSPRACVCAKKMRCDTLYPI